jgi:hypothetical protein
VDARTWRARRVAVRQQSRASGARWAFLATIVAVMGLGGAAGADEIHAGREGWTFDFRLGAGAATNTYDESDRPVADFGAFVLGGGLRLGGFIGPQLLLGFELDVLWGSGVGELSVRNPGFFSDNYDGYPRGDSYGYFSPLGIFVEFYPVKAEGFFMNVSGGIGIVELPDIGPGDYEAFMSRYAFELGYELSRTRKEGPALYLHFERWTGSETGLSTDYPDGMVSSQLLAGLRWTL